MCVKTLFVLAAGRLQLPAIEVAKRLGLRVVVADGDPKAPGLALADVAHVVNITDPKVCLAVAKAEHVNGVIHICSEVAMVSVGLVNRELGLSGVDPDTVLRATNKEHMRRAFERGGAPSPQSIAVTSDDEALAAAALVGCALIVKPSRNSGSRGITHLPQGSTPGMIISAFRRALSESRDRSALIEKYIEGPEFSIEALVWNGRIEILAITDKLTTGKPHFVEMGHSQPTQLIDKDVAAVREAAIQGIRALGLNGCAAHVEIKLAPDGPYLIEIGARLGGDFITTELVPRSSGIDMVAAAIRLSLGEEPDLTPRHLSRGAAIRYLAPPPGTVKKIEGVAEALRMPGVKIVDVYVVPGDHVGLVDSSLTRAGHVIAEGATAEEAVRNAERARDIILIETVDD
jgi:biotin carboxylase